jgi:hypothetical protein
MWISIEAERAVKHTIKSQKLSSRSSLFPNPLSCRLMKYESDKLFAAIPIVPMVTVRILKGIS